VTTPRIFVTGCAGMIGSSIAKAMLAAGHKVVGIDNLWRGTSNNLAALKANAAFEYRHADIAADRNWSFDVGGDDTIIHTADIVAGIGFVFANEWTIFQKNLLINTEIARIVHFQHPRQLIYLGTACSYPQGLQRSTEGSVLSEAVKFPADPESGYGWSKLIGDIEFRLAVKGKSTRLTVLDLHNVYGWPCVYRDNTAQVIPALIMKAITSTDRSLTVWGDGKQGRAFVHVDDVVAAVAAAYAYGGAHDNFMIGPDRCTTIAEVAELIRQHPRIAIGKVVFDTTKPTGDIGRYADAARAKAELDWVPRINFKDGLYDLIDKVIEDWQSNRG
jgi:GDP-D-mannose 3',5'-epimerase